MRQTNTFLTVSLSKRFGWTDNSHKISRVWYTFEKGQTYCRLILEDTTKANVQIVSALIAWTLTWKGLKRRRPRIEEDNHVHQNKQIFLPFPKIEDFIGGGMTASRHRHGISLYSPAALFGCYHHQSPPRRRHRTAAAGSTAPGRSTARLTCAGRRLQQVVWPTGKPREGSSGPGQQNPTARRRSSPALHTPRAHSHRLDSHSSRTPTHTPVPISAGLALPSVARRVRPRRPDLRQSPWWARPPSIFCRRVFARFFLSCPLKNHSGDEKRLFGQPG